MKKRLWILISDSILLTFLGLVYAWSVFKKPLATAYGFNDSQLTWTFTICMFLFCLGGFAGAQFSKKISHRSLTWICAGAIGISFVALGFMSSLWQLYVLYGVLIGFSVGIVYNCVLATGNKWYPDKGGLVAGLLLMFFGAGSLFLSPLSNKLLEAFGLKTAFLVLGVLFAVFLFLCGFAVRMPKEGEVPSVAVKAAPQAQVQTTPKEMLKTRNFWVFFSWCMLGTAIGIAVVGQIYTISAHIGLSSTTCALMVSLFAVASGLGRFGFGYFYDRKGRRLTTSVLSILFFLGGLTMGLGLLFRLSFFTVSSFVFFGLAYGGVTPTNANFARSFYGNLHYATNLSLVNFNILVAVFLGQFLGSGLYVRTGGYVATAVALTVTAALSFAVQFFIKDPTPISTEKTAEIAEKE